MRKMLTQEELNIILDKHKRWRREHAEGVWSTIYRAHPLGYIFEDTDKGEQAVLIDVDLSGLNLREADLSEAILTNVGLVDANLTRACFHGAELKDVDFRFANLNSANFCRAKLTDVKFLGANLNHVMFRYATFDDVDMRCSTLYDAVLSETNLSDVQIEWPIACPEKGSFIGFKKVYARGIFDGCISGAYIAELEIPADALRSSATSRKCRCSKAKVVSITDLEGNEAKEKTFFSGFDAKFEYTVGETIEIDNFDLNRWNECAPGIHFFITRQEAVDY